jgi:hypothetical protein
MGKKYFYIVMASVLGIYQVANLQEKIFCYQEEISQRVITGWIYAGRISGGGYSNYKKSGTFYLF